MKSYDERAKEILSQRDEKVKESAIRRRKAGRLAVIAAVLALTIVGASVFAVIAYKAKEKPADPTVTDTTAAADTAADTDKPADTTPKEYKDGVIGERDPSAEEPSDGIALDGRGYYSDKASSPKSGFSPAPASPSEEAKIGYEYIEGYDGEVNAVDAAAGTLTAGEWKDADNIADWLKLLSKDEWKGFVNSRKLDTANIVTVKVTDGENACFNVPVKLLSGDEVIYTGKTDINGRAYLFGNITGNDKTADAVSVGEQTVALDGKTEIEISAAEAGVKVTALDLMLMIDTTGSMGDELEYIKAELYDVVERVAKAGESISIRVSVNFYRDEGDDYTVKFFDFREDINECIEQLKEQSAYGGGDYPEAVHTALDNAVSGHDWREEAVKLCFIVLDAPPHSESEIQEVNVELLKTVKTAAEQGIRIIPVASSGVDGETEFLLRSWALMTGGTYIFITNDSGIGGGHKEAEVGEHTVEFLNECMIRVACEYCGIYAGEKVPYTPPYHQ